jgi:hypothetical protein
MPFHLVSSRTTYIRGNHVWIVEGKREICLTYLYYPETGYLWYAASIFRKPYANYMATTKEIEDHETTCERRWELRPAHVRIVPHLEMYDLIKKIRRQMCFGPGCKGPRINKKKRVINDTESQTSSENSYLSSVVEQGSYSSVLTNDLQIYTMSRIYHEKNQSREIFVVFTISGYQIRYGATIQLLDRRSNDTATSINSKADKKAHFDTAEDRYGKCPVRYTLSGNHEIDMLAFAHGEYRPHAGEWPNSDIPLFLQNAIFDNINHRKKGQYQIRGDRIISSVA